MNTGGCCYVRYRQISPAPAGVQSAAGESAAGSPAGRDQTCRIPTTEEDIHGTITEEKRSTRREPLEA